MTLDLPEPVSRDPDLAMARFQRAGEAIAQLGAIEIDDRIECAVVALRSHRTDAEAIAPVHHDLMARTGEGLTVHWRWGLIWPVADPLDAMIGVDLIYDECPGRGLTLAFHAWRDREWLQAAYECGRMAWIISPTIEVPQAAFGIACDVDRQGVGELLRNSEARAREALKGGRRGQRRLHTIQPRGQGQRRRSDRAPRTGRTRKGPRR